MVADGDDLNRSPGMVDFICPTCLKSFQHSKHLKRHRLTHGSESGQYQCPTCSKVFIRKDGLQRHSRIHRDTTPSLVVSRGRACDKCVAAKTKCSGSLPCTRCHARHIECRFPAAAASPHREAEFMTGIDVCIQDSVSDARNIL